MIHMNMTMAMKSSKKMRGGFMCQSPAATAVCKTTDLRLVIVPRRSVDQKLVDSRHARLVNTATTKYTRLVDQRRQFDSPAKNGRRSSTNENYVVPSVIISSDHHHRHQDYCMKQRDLKAAVAPYVASSVASSDQVFQVVVMRVSIHCQGCAGKVKKHLSKMEGVTSFSIDLENKRVTVMGHVSPVGVLESMSKVKRAEFWPC
ncbi:hypothetical protein RJ639_036017 [Escallonia herrerae]|uniref:HMA domain-containing protein n=1 Tax=Escallonia herrerae TaxID=1293975 RepID=A0AA88WPR6_9ASTE|nr:hypothetical protein RJ639_036017 [Escallonia herrerae]